MLSIHVVIRNFKLPNHARSAPAPPPPLHTRGGGGAGGRAVIGFSPKPCFAWIERAREARGRSQTKVASLWMR